MTLLVHSSTLMIFLVCFCFSLIYISIIYEFYCKELSCFLLNFSYSSVFSTALAFLGLYRICKSMMLLFALSDFNLVFSFFSFLIFLDLDSFC